MLAWPIPDVKDHSLTPTEYAAGPTNKKVSVSCLSHKFNYSAVITNYYWFQRKLKTVRFVEEDRKMEKQPGAQFVEVKTGKKKLANICQT